MNIDKITLRKFNKEDIENKIKWINDEKNNQYLHYDLPLIYEKTITWYEKIKDDISRYDAVIEYENIPVGIIGLINIDEKKKKAEYYITLGEQEYKGKGIATIATKKIVEFGFKNYNIEKIWLCVDEDNIIARKLYEKVGFTLEGILKKDIYFKDKMINRCMYGICKDEWRIDNEYINN